MLAFELAIRDSDTADRRDGGPLRVCGNLVAYRFDATFDATLSECPTVKFSRNSKARIGR